MPNTTDETDESTRTTDQRRQPVDHEFKGYLHYLDSGPWHELAAIGETETTALIDGKPWTVTVIPKTSGFSPEQVPGAEAPIMEPKLHVERAEWPGRAPPKVTFMVSPRTPHTSGPNPAAEWINVDADGSNVPLDGYPRLFAGAIDALGIDASGVTPDDLHPSSCIVESERYLRVANDHMGALTGDAGPIKRLTELFGRDRTRLRINGESHNTEALIDTEAAGTLIEGHRIGKGVKVYTGRDPPEDENDPVAHPKLCVRAIRGETDDSIKWSDRDEVRDEIDELAVNLVSWSGLTASSPRTFVGDEHFSPDRTIDAGRELRSVDDPLPSIRAEQENAVRDACFESTPAERDVLRALADGGHAVEPTGEGMHYKTLAERAGRSLSTVYRSVGESLAPIVKNVNGAIRLASTKIKNALPNYMSMSDRERPSERSADDEGGNEGETTNDAQRTNLDLWDDWASKHGVTTRPDQKTISERGHRDGPARWLAVDLGELDPGMTGDDLRELTEDGRRAWVASGRPEGSYRGARFVWREAGAERTSEAVGYRLPGVTLSADQAEREPKLKSLR